MYGLEYKHIRIEDQQLNFKIDKILYLISEIKLNKPEIKLYKLEIKLCINLNKVSRGQ